ncbi:MAG TPA: ATP-binding protein [Anaerovoracaceae bacterium]|nr:ATP-binding protein [Anaerovoracaceae bacterium]
MPQNIKIRREFLADTLSSIGDGVIVADLLGTVLYVNPSGEKMTGWSNKAAAGKPFSLIFSLIDYSTGRRLNDPIRPVLEQGRSVGLKDRSALINREGKTLFVSASCSPVRNGNNEVTGAVVVFRDIDRIKNVEEAVRREKNNLQNVLEALPLGVLLIDEDAVVNWVNKPFLELFHLEEANTVGRRFGDGVRCVNSVEKGCGGGEQCEWCEIRQNVRRVVRERTSQRDVVIQRSFFNDMDATCFWLKISFIPLAIEDEGQIVIAIEDITEQKNYEAMLQKGRDEAESASKVKSEFLANMSHEIRTPLNGMMGMLDLLLMSDTTEEQRDYVRMAKLSAESLLKVINDILDFSRIEAGKISITDVHFDIKDLTTEIIKINTVLAERKGLHIQYAFAPGIPRYLVGDPDRLRQILNNLIGNAIKFTNRGQIRVEVRKTGGTKQKVDLEYRISDTGIGISAEKMSQLFKRFSQVDGSLTRRYSGAGLGLAISRELAEMMGGNIRAESEIGKGSTFCLAISFFPGEAPSVAARNEPALEADQSLSMIVMDGEELNRFIPEQTINRSDADKHQDGARKYRYVRLDEDGEIVLNGGREAAVKGDMDLELIELDRILYELRLILQENRYFMIEETAHRIKKIALRTDMDDLVDLAFKAELAARKYNWDQAAQYCLRIMERQRQFPAAAVSDPTG